MVNWRDSKRQILRYILRTSKSVRQMIAEIYYDQEFSIQKIPNETRLP